MDLFIAKWEVPKNSLACSTEVWGVLIRDLRIFSQHQCQYRRISSRTIHCDNEPRHRRVRAPATAAACRCRATRFRASTAAAAAASAAAAAAVKFEREASAGLRRSALHAARTTSRVSENGCRLRPRARRARSSVIRASIHSRSRRASGCSEAVSRGWSSPSTSTCMRCYGCGGGGGGGGWCGGGSGGAGPLQLSPPTQLKRGLRSPADTAASTNASAAAALPAGPLEKGSALARVPPHWSARKTQMKSSMCCAHSAI
jgi:hypothetical protein